MARIKIHVPCQRPVRECDCPPDDDDEPGAVMPDEGSDDGEAA